MVFSCTFKLVSPVQQKTTTTENKEITHLFYQPRNYNNSHAKMKLEKAANILGSLF